MADPGSGSVRYRIVQYGTVTCGIVWYASERPRCGGRARCRRFCLCSEGELGPACALAQGRAAVKGSPVW